MSSSAIVDSPNTMIEGKQSQPVLFTFQHDGSGKFVVAEGPLKTGTTVFEEVGAVKSKPDKYTLQLDDNQHMLCSGPLIFCNHSCDPNCMARVFYGLVEIVTIRDVKKGEPITFDYNTTEWDMASPFDCMCGSANCKGRIAGFKNLTPAQQKSINKSFMSAFIREKALAIGE